MQGGIPVHKMSTKTPIVIWGAGGHATVVTEILEMSGRWSIVGYLDEVNPGRWGTTFDGYPILGGREALQGLGNMASSISLLHWGITGLGSEQEKRHKRRGWSVSQPFTRTHIFHLREQLGRAWCVQQDAS
jgi:FlaA1/EpsC-like NDP-sugar epimerase